MNVTRSKNIHRYESVLDPVGDLGVTIVSANRDTTGRWVVQLSIFGTVRIDSTRTVIVDRVVNVRRCKQTGRKKYRKVKVS